jgi:membrane protein
MLLPRKLLHCFTRAFVNTIKHDGIEHAGYLAFLLLLALFPFLVLLMALATFFGESQAGIAFTHMALSQLPPRMIYSLQARIDEIAAGPPTGLLSVAILGAIWTASSAVEGFRTVLNRAYHVGTPPSYVLRRLLSIIQLLVFTFLVLAGMSLLILLPIAISKFHDIAGLRLMAQHTASWSYLIFTLTLIALLAIVANMYYILPNIRQSLMAVLPGAWLTVALWMLAARLLSLYLSHFRQVNLIYGSLGGIIATLLFFYIINVIFIYGAEFNYLLARALGERMVQREAAAPKEKEEEED